MNELSYRRHRFPAIVIQQLPAPLPAAAPMRAIAAQARRLANGSPDDAAPLQAAIAKLYGLTGVEFAHILSTFPLIAPTERAAALQTFEEGGL